ncbi:unnamed protein product, partial [marine sediment metagenome]
AALAAALTLAPAVFLALREKAFWPGRADAALVGTLATRFWRWVAAGVCRKPAKILVTALILMTPFVYFGITMTPSYDLFSELPADMHSVRGHRYLLEKFDNRALPGQLTAVLSSDVDIRSTAGLMALKHVLAVLQKDERVVEVRSMVSPLGKYRPELGSPLWWKGTLLLPVGNLARDYAEKVLSHYVSRDRRSMKIDIVLKHDGFSHEAMDSVPIIRDELRGAVARTGLKGGSVRLGGLSAY